MEKSTAIFGSITALILLFIVLTLLVLKSKSANSKEFIPEKKATIKEKVSFNGEDIERLKLIFSGITAISLLTIAIILFGVCVHYYKGVGFYLETDLYVPSTISIESIRAPIGIDYINRIGYSDTIDVNADVTIKNLR
ncbi:hypothetical protein [Campylobacter gracilis]|nr:hypothetical protein [Campylobacter gracilis]AKT93168.1 putative membrane protein [Campylobacter gracilis]UEB44662.1 hypothetical protein LK410_06450 [Campylobacter gracilis]SUW78500.1 Uncharacterised protein [Campylobacter gracilis]